MRGARWYVPAAVALAATVSACSPIAPPGGPGVTSISATTVAAASAGGLGGIVGKDGDPCGLLGPGDFGAAGIAGAQSPSENSDGAGSYFCDYSGQSDSSGSIELDAFVGSVAAYDQLAADNGVSTDDATAELGADRAGTNLNGPGYTAVIVACKGGFCFDISIPNGSGTRTQLISLAKLVLQRGAALTS